MSKKNLVVHQFSAEAGKDDRLHTFITDSKSQYIKDLLNSWKIKGTLSKFILELSYV